jgi:hypothetical protein
LRVAGEIFRKHPDSLTQEEEVQLNDFLALRLKDLKAGIVPGVCPFMLGG